MLERAILDSPGSEDAYLVYADWLQVQGDPRGELIAIEHAALRTPDNHALIGQRELRRADLLGDLAEPLALTTALRLEWRLGFIDAITIDVPGCYRAELWPSELMSRLCAHPASRLVRSVAITGLAGTRPLRAGPGSAPIDVLAPLLAALARARLPGLTELALHTATSEPLFSSAEQIRALAALSLASLTITCGSLPRDGILALCRTDLERLTLAVGSFPELEWLAFDAAPWPRLSRLVVTVGEPHMQLPAGLLSGARFPALRHLGVMAAPHTDDLLDSILASPLRGQLRGLDATFDRLTEAGRTALIQRAHTLAGLTLLPTAGLTFRWWGDGDEQAHGRFIVFMENMGLLDQALALYERAIAADPHRALAWLGKARVLARLGRSEEAAACFDQVAVIDPARWPAR